jgi:hypothetical protein
MAEAEPSDLLVISRQEDRSEYVNSEPGVQFIIDHLGGVLNIHLARLWGSRRLVFVEGEDLSLLKHFQTILFPNSDSPLDAIPNMQLGGWGGWNYAVGCSILLKNTLGDRTRIYCILDRDYHSEIEIDKRLAEAARHGIQLHIWAKKEIENYLLSPKALHKLIRTRATRTPPTIEEIENQLTAIAEKLKNVVVDGVTDAYHLEERKLQPSHCRATRQGVGWESLAYTPR